MYLKCKALPILFFNHPTKHFKNRPKQEQPLITSLSCLKEDSIDAKFILSFGNKIKTFIIINLFSHSSKPAWNLTAYKYITSGSPRTGNS